MLCVRANILDPYFNLASEEYLLKNTVEDFFLLYRNLPSVIVGKHQNTLAEINLPFVEQEGIRVARRLSGGGAVYHDEGNLNFCFIMNGEEGKLVDFGRYMQPVLDVLAGLDLDVSFGKRNEIRLEGYKISGNAEHIYKNRILHHGTLLFETSLEKLHSALRVNPMKYRDKAVKSIRSRVVNISDYLKAPMDISHFCDRVFDHILMGTDGSAIYRLSETDLSGIRELMEARYTAWEWIYGYSPAYEVARNVIWEGQPVRIHLGVDKGTIRHLHFSGEGLQGSILDELAASLVGQPHSKEALRKLIATLRPDTGPFPAEEIVGLFF